MPSLEQLRLTARAKDDAIEQRLRPRRPPLPSSLPSEDEAAVDALLARRGAISKCVREQVTDKDISRLRPYQWLNDEVINFYGQMLLLRSEDSKENSFLSINETNGRVNGNVVGKTNYLNVHYFNTFFWTKLKDEGYEKGRLAKWTKKVRFPSLCVLYRVSYRL
jgi:sentrin-specific protease 1